MLPVWIEPMELRPWPTVLCEPLARLPAKVFLPPFIPVVHGKDAEVMSGNAGAPLCGFSGTGKLYFLVAV